MKEPSEAAAAVLGGKQEPKKLKVREVTIRKGHAGGYIARHRLEDEQGQTHPREHEYPLLSLKDVHDHLTNHMPEDKKEDGEAAAC